MRLVRRSERPPPAGVPTLGPRVYQAKYPRRSHRLALHSINRARSYASDFSPASSDGRRGGATGALSPPTTQDVHLAPSRLRAPTGAATCSSPAHGACALRHRDRMAPVVVAADSRGGYSRLPTEQRVTTSSCSARAQRSRESPTRCRMVAVVPMRTCWSRPAATVATPMAPMDGSNGTEASDCVDVPPVRLCDRGERQP